MPKLNMKIACHTRKLLSDWRSKKRGQQSEYAHPPQIMPKWKLLNQIRFIVAKIHIFCSEYAKKTGTKSHHHIINSTRRDGNVLFAALFGILCTHACVCSCAAISLTQNHFYQPQVSLCKLQPRATQKWPKMKKENEMQRKKIQRFCFANLSGSRIWECVWDLIPLFSHLRVDTKEAGKDGDRFHKRFQFKWYVMANFLLLDRFFSGIAVPVPCLLRSVRMLSNTYAYARVCACAGVLLKSCLLK